MPIYEYRCESCNQVVEILQKLSDPAPEKCAACHQGPMRKLMSQTSFILKGTGWYVTDFKNDKKAPNRGEKSAASDPSSSSASESSSSSTESSPAPQSASGSGESSGSSTRPKEP